MRTRRRGLSLAVAALIIGSVAAGAALARVPSGPDPATVEWPEWPHQVSCGGGLPFDPVVAFSGPTGVERGRLPAERALRRFLRRGLLDWAPRHGWRTIVSTARVVEFTAGLLGEDPELFVFERRGNRWKWVSSGGCTPTSLRRDRPAVTWTLAADQKLTPETRSVRINLGPGECSSGRSQNDRVQRPEFREQNGALLMSIWLRPLPPGGYTCLGLIEPPLTVKLPEPLGERLLLDGGTYPPGSGRPETGD